MDGVCPRHQRTCLHSSRLPRRLSYSKFVENQVAVQPVLTWEASLIEEVFEGHWNGQTAGRGNDFEIRLSAQR